MSKSLCDIALDKLEHESFWVGSHAAGIYNALTMLSERPEYRTRARAGLDDAEIKLINALEAVRAAKEQYDRLPVAQEAAE